MSMLLHASIGNVSNVAMCSTYYFGTQLFVALNESRCHQQKEDLEESETNFSSRKDIAMEFNGCDM